MLILIELDLTHSKPTLCWYKLHLTRTVVDNSVLFYFSCGRWGAAVLTQRQEGSSCGLLLVDFERDLMYALTGKMKLVWKTS